MKGGRCASQHFCLLRRAGRLEPAGERRALIEDVLFLRPIAFQKLRVPRGASALFLCLLVVSEMAQDTVVRMLLIGEVHCKLLRTERMVSHKMRDLVEAKLYPHFLRSRAALAEQLLPVATGSITTSTFVYGLVHWHAYVRDLTEVGAQC